tara:strand:- start:390 stop:1667 length:1278 start_codon:yes stop_codon:yes gene_type:complete
MAVTQKGVWDVQEVRDKQIQDEWGYSAPGDPGGLWVWGSDGSGQTGQDNYDGPNLSSPTQIGTETTWDNIQAGNGMMGVKSNGTMWVWGNGSQGNLGLNESGNTDYRSSPTQLGTNTNWQATGGIGQFAIGSKTNGSLWAWGSNHQGFLGQNEGGHNQDYRSSPVEVPGFGGTWSTNKGGFIQGRQQGGGWVLATQTDGTLWYWGDNGDFSGGQGGTSQGSFSQPIQIGTDTTWRTTDGSLGTSGKTSCFAIKVDGTLWSWGTGDEGVLAHANNTRYSSPKQVGTDTTWEYLSKGCGDADNQNNMFAIKTDGTLWAWGENLKGSLGINKKYSNEPNRNSPSQVGTDTTWDRVSHGKNWALATKTDNTLWAWGWKWYGVLGQNASTPYGGLPYVVEANSSPVQIPGTKWKYPASGNMSALAIRFAD